LLAGTVFLTSLAARRRDELVIFVAALTMWLSLMMWVWWIWTWISKARRERGRRTPRG
jgi:hypothetical protein